jgi:hypothetical protein
MFKNQEQFCRQLAERFSTASRVLVEHLDDYDNLLPHVFVAELTRHLLREPIDRAQIVQSLEDSLSSGDPEIAELIAASFLENVENRNDLSRLLNGVTGSSLLAEWTRLHS